MNTHQRAILLPVAILFAGSGCAALIYELVWFQLLEFVIGSSAISIGVLLATFMGGLCLGSLLFARVIPAGWRSLHVWAALEAGIGLLGVGALFLVPAIRDFYAINAVGGMPGIGLRALTSAACILAPAMLMGATLPAISRVVSGWPGAVSSAGLLYSANTFGAVCGCVLAGFYLLRFYDLATATYFAATINVLIAVGALLIPRLETPARNAPREAVEYGQRVKGTWAVCLVAGLSGFCSLSAEVIWTRTLSLILGATVYAFAIVLSVFLVGLALGSAAGATLAGKVRRPGVALGYCQLVSGAAIAWTAYLLTKSLPYWPIDYGLVRKFSIGVQVDFLRSAWALLPATLCWGAAFPLALAAAPGSTVDLGPLVARIYAANTIGAILGALGSSLVLIAWLGTQHTQQLLIVLAAISGLIALALGLPEASPRPILSRGANWNWEVLAKMAAGISIAGLLAWSVPQLPWALVAYGRYLPTKTGLGVPLYVGEGLNAAVAVTELSTGVRNFHVSGKVEASTDVRDMRLQRILAHLPALLHSRPRSVLVVGCGAGVTAGSFLAHPSIERLVICEIEPLVPTVVANFFATQNYNLLKDPRVHVVYDDARRYLLTSHEKFDIITSDPIHPWVKGAATLYTREYFDLCRQHLNAGGRLSQWVPLYESNLAVVKSELATFFDVFPRGTIWSNDDMGEGDDVVLLGQEEPLRIDIEEVQRRFARPELAAVAASLREVGIKSAYGLTATYVGRVAELGPWLQDAAINRDRNLRLQYLAGAGLNSFEPGLIYDNLLAFRRFPADLFVGTNVWTEALRKLIEKPPAAKSP